MKKSTERKLTTAVGAILVVQIGGVLIIMIVNAVHKHRYHRDLLDTEELALQFASVEGIELQEPHARAHGNEIIVDGCLHSTVEKEPIVSRVSVALRSHQGVALSTAAVDKLTRCKRGGFYFKTKLEGNASDGALLDIDVVEGRPQESTDGATVPDPDG